MPMFLQGHDPVHVSKGAEERISDDAGRTQGASFAGGRGIGGGVLFQRVLAQPRSDPDHDAEEEERARNKSPGILVGMALLKDCVVCKLSRLGPGIELAQAKKN